VCGSFGKCFCSPGSTGASCEEPLTSSCQNRDIEMAGRCFCQPGWSGPTCEEGPAAVTCDHGISQEGRCFCEPGWIGKSCETPVASVIPKVDCVTADDTNPVYAIARFGFESFAGNISPRSTLYVNGNISTGAPRSGSPVRHHSDQRQQQPDPARRSGQSKRHLCRLRAATRQQPDGAIAAGGVDSRGVIHHGAHRQLPRPLGPATGAGRHHHWSAQRRSRAAV
jgi:hypothetical protein